MKRVDEKESKKDGKDKHQEKSSAASSIVLCNAFIPTANGLHIHSWACTTRSPCNSF